MQRLKTATDTLKELAAIYLVLVVFSAGLFALLEGEGLVRSLYWAGTTATSTGYGDITPKTTAGQFLAVVLMHLAIFGVAPLIVVRLVNRMIDDQNAFTHEEQLEILQGIARLEEAVKRLEADRQVNGSHPATHRQTGTAD
jgi:voltage-gated potassium channel